MEYFLKIVVMIRPIVEFTQFWTISLVLRTVARHMTPPEKQWEEDVTGVSDFLSLSVRKGPESQRFWPKLSWSFRLQLDLNWRILTWQSNILLARLWFWPIKGTVYGWSCCFYWKLLKLTFHLNEMDFPRSPRHPVIKWCPTLRGYPSGAILGPFGGWGRGQQRVRPGPDCSSDF